MAFINTNKWGKSANVGIPKREFPYAYRHTPAWRPCLRKPPTDAQTDAHRTSPAFPKAPMHSHPKNPFNLLQLTTAEVNVVPALFLLAKSVWKVTEWREGSVGCIIGIERSRLATVGGPHFGCIMVSVWWVYTTDHTLRVLENRSWTTI